MWMYNVFDFGNFRQKETSDAASAYIFFELSKYPPSLTFLAFTLGTNFLLLYIFHQLVNVLHNTLIANILLAFGRSSLFFYMMHFLALPLVSLAFPDGVPDGRWIPLLWFILLVCLYPWCQKFYEFKSKKDVNSLWRLF